MFIDQAAGLRALKPMLSVREEQTEQAAGQMTGTAGAVDQSGEIAAAMQSHPQAVSTEARPIRTIAITGGKGGVGKTTVSVNLALALNQLGQRVVLMDADLGLANVDVMLGLSSDRNLSHVVAGECSLREVLLEGPMGLRIIPAASGIREMVELDPMAYMGLIHAFSELEDELDVLVVDTAAGISNMVGMFCHAVQEVIVVVCDEPASITDAYALIKVLFRDYGIRHFNIISNMAQNPAHGKKLFDSLDRVLTQYLQGQVHLHYMGPIPADASVKVANRKQTPVLMMKPNAPVSRAFMMMAQNILARWPMPLEENGRIQFFLERLLRSGT